MPAPVADTIVLGGLNTTEAHVVGVPTHAEINEKTEKVIPAVTKDETSVEDSEIKAAPPLYHSDSQDKDEKDTEDVIIITGADASEHLLPIRDDHDPAITFRSLFLASGLSAFQAVMTQIYNVS